MTSSNQPHRIFGLTNKGLIIIGVAVVFACVGVGAGTLVVSRLVSAVATALNQPTDTPEPTRQSPTETPIPPATSLPTATRLPAFTPTPAPTATPEPGQSRSHPLPPNSIVQADDWQVQVLEFKRGAEAAQLIHDANQFNEPAPAGKEYLLVRVHAKGLHTDGQSHRITGGDFKLTGDRLTRYLPIGVVPPDPQLHAELFSGGETEGWIVYEIGSGEEQLIVEFDPLDNSLGHPIFIALQAGSMIAVDPSLSEITPTDLGRLHDQPAKLGDTLITDDWQVTVLEAIRGTQAYDLAKAANQFNDPPAAGMEYLAVRARVKNLNPQDDFVMIDSGSFKSIGDKQVLYDAPSVVDPEPALSAYLYPGGEVEGWVILQIGQGESHAQIVFDPLFDMQQINRRYIALPEQP
jgi:hypothetical protein